ncbi:integral membrane protein [Colletotrichum plurivorum]|uniref:Integral membrane protein n=1 Tax=Colletotrichum plurivorum TaxID=2175906 RepID=A0A8H6KBB3_9PEZI|nr:integral membrane protein [Colletotrichum plurivorum]
MDDSLYVMPPPEGQVRTEVDPPNTSGAVYPVGIATTVIAFVAVALRIFTRTYVMRGRLGIDDYLALVALALALAYCGFALHLVPVGAGKHIWDVLVADYSPPFLLTTLGITITYSTSVSFSKLSILTFYLRLSPERKFRWTVFVLIGIVSAYTVVYQILIIFQCQPVSMSWDINAKGTCIGKMIPMMTLSAANIVIDIIILLIPVKVVWSLQMARRQKVSLVFLFATGGFVCAAAIQRTIILPPLLESSDYTWEVPPQMIWGFIEINAGLICAAVPALKPFFMRYLPFILASTLRSSQERSKYGAYSNPIDKSSKRQRGGVQTFELPSRDDLPGGCSSRSGRDDDEAKLWSHGKGMQGKRMSTQKTESDLGSDKKDNDSIDSVEAQYPGRVGPAIVVTSWGRGSEDLQTPTKGINVTRETKVSYDRQ